MRRVVAFGLLLGCVLGCASRPVRTPAPSPASLRVDVVTDFAPTRVRAVHVNVDGVAFPEATPIVLPEGGHVAMIDVDIVEPCEGADEAHRRIHVRAAAVVYTQSAGTGLRLILKSRIDAGYLDARLAVSGGSLAPAPSEEHLRCSGLDEVRRDECVVAARLDAARRQRDVVAARCHWDRLVEIRRRLPDALAGDAEARSDVAAWARKSADCMGEATAENPTVWIDDAFCHDE